jgi:predicted CXXCH cytochrome family protein
MKKALKISALVGLVLVAILAAGMVSAAKKQVPEYVGSQACLGCHADRWSSWAGSGHGTMILPIKTTADIPGWDKATKEQQAELLKADYVVAGARFLARDPATGNNVFLKYEWVAKDQKWIDYTGVGTVWQNSCMGCHTTGAGKSGVANQPAEFGIGCESCHGPGRDHIQGKGDVSKITLNVSSDVCGRCHNGGYKMTDNRWIYGYKPNMKLTDVTGIIMPAIDPNKTANLGHHQEYDQWLVSSHGPKAVSDLKANSHASSSCYACHTQEARAAEEEGKTFTADKNAEYAAISCVTCHRPHGLGLAADEKELCTSCHTGEIAQGGLKPGATAHHPNKEFFAGTGAAGGITSSTGNFHAEVTCQECHMANNNHLMQVVKPDAAITAGSDDACTTCHKDSDRETRAAYLNMWENTTTKRIDALKADIKVIEATGTTLPADLKVKLDTVKTNIGFIEADGSKGAHNFNYASKILTAAQKDLATVKAFVGK